MDLFIFILLGIAFFLGILVSQLFVGFSKKSDNHEEAEIPPPSPPVSPKSEPVQGETLLRLWKDSSGTLRLDLDGKPVSVLEITQTGQRRLVTLLNATRPWVEKKMPPAPPPPPPAAPISRPVTARPSPAIEVDSDSKKEIVDKPLSMVEEIDKILQTKLETHPLKSRGIRIVESPTGGVVVYVGLSRYEGVAEIPDASIQAVIREAITEWEEISTPK